MTDGFITTIVRMKADGDLIDVDLCRRIGQKKNLKTENVIILILGVCL